MNKNEKIFAAGILAGMLIAPEKGSETRKKINAKGRKFVKVVKEEYEKNKDKFKDLKTKAEKAVKKVKNTLHKEEKS